MARMVQLGHTRQILALPWHVASVVADGMIDVIPETGPPRPWESAWMERSKFEGRIKTANYGECPVKEIHLLQTFPFLSIALMLYSKSKCFSALLDFSPTSPSYTSKTF